MINVGHFYIYTVTFREYAKSEGPYLKVYNSYSLYDNAERRLISQMFIICGAVVASNFMKVKYSALV